MREIANHVPVTDAILKAPKPEDWLMYRGNYAGWGYSPLRQIDKSNVKNLQLVWSRAMAAGDNEITPIVYNDVMYLANPNDVIQAIDASSGDLLWEYKHPLPPRDQLHNHQGEHKRSLALYGNFVVFVSFGFYNLWWTYNLMQEPNQHFEINWAWEDSLARAAQALHQ